MFIFSVRPRPHYTIYIAPIIFSALFMTVNRKLKKNLAYFLIIFVLAINLPNVYKKIINSVDQIISKLVFKKSIILTHICTGGIKK